MSVFSKPQLYQGVYYFITGIWPLLHIKSFIWISGPKVDLWLVKMVGVLTVVIAITILLSMRQKSKTPFPIVFLALGSCLGYIGIDVYYALIDRIWDIYLLDTVLQILIIVHWVWFLRVESWKIES